MMKVDVLLGLQWGDEGKGKVVDVLAPDYDVIARFQGGPNAGHSLEFDNIRHVLHCIPSGIFHPEKINIVGNGLVIDPIVFKKELDALSLINVNYMKNLIISKKAHLILPTHRILDAAVEASKGDTKIGSTLRGIGPAYMDKTGRNGLRVGDLLNPDFDKKYRFLTDKHRDIIEQYNFSYNIKDYEAGWQEGIDMLRKLNLADSEYLINDYIANNKSILAEGAQGTLLDIDFGSYPYVTSSNTITAGACTGLGIAPNRIGKVLGIVKAYCTRVGGGPFPTELHDTVGEQLRNSGNEFGSTTGRPRRCGWLDLVALKYSVMINGVTDIIITKIDVLSSFDTIKVCTKYKVNGNITNQLPFDLNSTTEPIYTNLKGWKKDITKAQSMDDLPKETVDYIIFIEEELQLPVSIVSVGPERKATIFKNK